MTDPSTVAPILIAGCGNGDAADDGFGLLVIRRLAQQPVAGVELLELGGRPILLLDQLPARAGLIVIDAARAEGMPAGQVFDEDWYGSVRGHLAAERSCSTHGFGIATQLALARTLGLLPARTRLLGVTIENIGLGQEPSGKLQYRIDEVAGRAAVWAAAWLASPEGAPDA
jgi:hydrogenase maturation protease